MDPIRAILVFVATLFFVLAPVMSGGFGGFDPAAFPVPQTDPPAQPAGWTFAIWGVIYVWLMASAGMGLFRRAKDPAWEPARLPLFVSLGPGAAWLRVAGESPVAATVLIVWMLAMALVAHLRTPAADRWWLAAPVALYAGWLSGAAWVALAVVLAGHGVLGGAAAAALALVGALATGLGVMARRPAPEYALALAWAFVGIAAANLPAAAALAGLSALAAAVLLWRGWQAMEKGAGT